ncbi:PREDICTED: sugar transporter ERD6-like 15 isoform X4 [Brassica oleracea var. oleracea]|uniref:sugar transporter ERD6-like 15 isoform X4 n=1 Tax=Brassica oleracea var. oleracea TaxID=109376 RepID=UPI0006A6C46F|nr:PREDICTED: sugar transporter ERD6-like 15 isoform X4 [Brassica oleracea var. oleracea]
MEEEGLLLASPSSSSPSLLSGISNVSTRPFVLAFTVCSCGAFVSGCVSGYSAPTQSGIMKDLNLSVADYSLFGSILTVGIILGALICGKLTDLVGRINVIWMLDMGRLLHGIGIGISAYLGPIYMTEITPRNLRGAVSSCSQLFAIVGSSLFYALGTVVGWRDLAILGAIPFLVIIPLLFFIPESPRWLAKVGREKEVKAVLLSLRGAESDISNEAQEILDYTEHVKQQEDGDSGFFKLFQRKYAFSLTIGVALIALPELGGNSGYSYYTDSIFTRTGVSSDFGFITTSLVQMLGGVLGTMLVDVSGRRSLLLVSQAGSFLGCLATAISFFLQENRWWEGGTSILALISVLVYFASYGLAMSSIPWIVASEIYPVDVKGAAGTVCNLAGSISSCLVAYSFNFLLQWSSTGTFLMFATVTGLGFVFIAKLVPETKGKSLEEIQSLFTDPPLKNSTS